MIINFAQTDYDQAETNAVNRVLSSPLLASGPENEAFEKEFAEYVGTNFSICVNSGSSANLLALASLNLSRGSKVLTSACGFPATLSPIIHCNLEPVLVDYDISTHNIDVSAVIKELHKVKAVILAHTLGSPVEMNTIRTYANILNVPIIEDCCEAAGTFLGDKSVGTFGTIGTFSFYPAHQITAGGGGGMIVTNDEKIYRRMKSLRDWGKMFDWDSGRGGNVTDYSSSIKYHRGYTYETIGYNFKLPELNAAFGREQLRKLDRFASMRQYRFEYLKSGLSDKEDFLTVSYLPTRISWFGYPITIKDGSPINRDLFGMFLESKGIRHRPFFAGNILKQPAFQIYSKWSEEFPVADKLMKDSLFIGCHTKITEEELDYMIKTIREYDANSCASELQRNGHAEGIDSISVGSDTQTG